MKCETCRWRDEHSECHHGPPSAAVIDDTGVAVWPPLRINEKACSKYERERK